MSKLTHQILRVALNGIESNGETANTYIKEVKNRFAPWAAENGIKVPKDVTKEKIQDYEEFLSNRGYSPSTIHTYLAPVCKAAKISMNEIDKPKRTSGAITRGRGGEIGERGRLEEKRPENERIVIAKDSIGIRKDEYKHLKGKDLVKGAYGGLYVHVAKGKGGKEHLQLILPLHEEAVNKLFEGILPEERVFSPEEMKRADKINMHGGRANVSKEAYAFHLNRLESEPGYSEKLKEKLLERYKEFHINVSPRSLKRFMDEMNNSKPIKTRGDNRQRCIEKGYPTEYNRLAVLAVSVFHLSHWRNDVTITNYLTA